MTIGALHRCQNGMTKYMMIVIKKQIGVHIRLDKKVHFISFRTFENSKWKEIKGLKNVKGIGTMLYL